MTAKKKKTVKKEEAVEESKQVESAVDHKEEDAKEVKEKTGAVEKASGEKDKGAESSPKSQADVARAFKDKKVARKPVATKPVLEVRGHKVEDLIKIDVSLLRTMFTSDKVPAEIAYDVMLLEKHFYELAQKVLYFHDVNSLVFRSYIMDLQKLFFNLKDAFVEERITKK